MLRRLRTLKISLAAKCQLLFGLAVALIIGAALFVPWQRMEQLTEQLDRGAASALAEMAVLTHVRQHTPPPGAVAASETASNPKTKPALQQPGDETLPRVPRLVSIDAPPLGPNPGSSDLTNFEQVALRHFRRH